MKDKNYDLNYLVTRFICAVIDRVEQGKATAPEVTALPEMVKIKIEYL